MSGFNIENFKSAMSGGGDRPTQFEVRMSIPAVASGDASAMEKLTFTCRAASIPPMIVGQVPLPYFGGKIKVAGDRQWPDWNITIINDEDYLVRRTMEQWSHKIKTVRKQTTFSPFNSNPASYKTDAFVYKYGKEGQLLRQYKFVGIWPSVVAEIQLDWSASDQIVEFPVTFAYDYMEDDAWIIGQDGSGVSNF